MVVFSEKEWMKIISAKEWRTQASVTEEWNFARLRIIMALVNKYQPQKQAGFKNFETYNKIYFYARILFFFQQHSI